MIANAKPSMRVEAMVISPSANEKRGQIRCGGLRVRTEGEVEALLNDDCDAECRQQRSEKVAGYDLADDRAIEDPADTPQHDCGDGTPSSGSIP